MKYPKYPAYTADKNAWGDEYPTHWQLNRLRFACIINPTKSEIADLPASTEVSFVPMEAVGEYGGIQLETTKMLEEVSQGYTYFRDGDVVVAKITPCFENGKGALAENLVAGVAFGTTELHVLRPRSDRVDPKFLFYVSISTPFRKLGEGEMYGAGGQKRVPNAFVENFKQPFPPLKEQRILAAFLDQETAQIDTLIARQERLIALLQEKRQALISHAVTKGLNPDAPMKDSGVEWLGEVPAHWEVDLIKRHFDVALGKMLNRSVEIDGGITKPYLRAANIHWHGVIIDEVGVNEMEFSPDQLQRYQLKKGDLLVTEGGVTVGRSAIFNEEVEDCYYQNSLNRIRTIPSGCVLTPYLYYWLYFAKENGYIDVLSDNATFGHLTNEKLKAFPMTVPPLAEQEQITTFLCLETAKIDELVEKTRAAIERSQERCTALISAAVTGKIDVRATMN